MISRHQLTILGTLIDSHGNIRSQRCHRFPASCVVPWFTPEIEMDEDPKALGPQCRPRRASSTGDRASERGIQHGPSQSVVEGPVRNDKQHARHARCSDQRPQAPHGLFHSRSRGRHEQQPRPGGVPNPRAPLQCPDRPQAKGEGAVEEEGEGEVVVVDVQREVQGRPAPSCFT